MNVENAYYEVTPGSEAERLIKTHGAEFNAARDRFRAFAAKYGKNRVGGEAFAVDSPVLPYVLYGITPWQAWPPVGWRCDRNRERPVFVPDRRTTIGREIAAAWPMAGPRWSDLCAALGFGYGKAAVFCEGRYYGHVAVRKRNERWLVRAYEFFGGTAPGNDLVDGLGSVAPAVWHAAKGAYRRRTEAALAGVA